MNETPFIDVLNRIKYDDTKPAKKIEQIKERLKGNIDKPAKSIYQVTQELGLKNSKGSKSSKYSNKMETVLDMRIRDLRNQLAEEKNELQKMNQEITDEQLEELN